MWPFAVPVWRQPSQSPESDKRPTVVPSFSRILSAVVPFASATPDIIKPFSNRRDDQSGQWRWSNLHTRNARFFRPTGLARGEHILQAMPLIDFAQGELVKTPL
jgi:hypothetical protein